MPVRWSMLAYLFIWLANRNIMVHSQAPFSEKESYAPVRVECPSDRQLLRLAGSPLYNNQTLSREESIFRAGRKSVTSPLWREFFTHGAGNATGYQGTALMAANQDDWPVLGMAHSGGGERATLYGAGVIHALDARTTASPIRGVYQLASYTTGLSGGSWLVGSMAAHDYPSVPELFYNLINMDSDIVMATGQFYTAFHFFEALFLVVLQKKLAGFKTSIIDYWGIALGNHFLPSAKRNITSAFVPTVHASGQLFSKLRNKPGVQQFQHPLPIIVSTQRPLVKGPVNPKGLPIQGTAYVPLSAPIYETSPFEFGSFDPQLSAFIPTEFLGTSLASGNPTADLSAANSTSTTAPQAKCVRGFDQIDFVMGSSAALCNVLIGGNVPGFPSSYMNAMKYFMDKMEGDDSLAAHYPNPFRGVNGPMGFDRSVSDELTIVDGGESAQNIPLSPLLAPARQVDVILAADASADTDASYKYGTNWPNGAAMINTWLRTHLVLPKGSTNFPPVPLQPQVWIKQGLNTRPTFFGCNAPTTQGNGGYPLIIYLPNSPLSPSPTNTSTFQLTYSGSETQTFLDSATNSTINPRFGPKMTVDSEWPTCLSCALIDRSRNRLQVARSAACEACFARYCYQDGVGQPTASY